MAARSSPSVSAGLAPVLFSKVASGLRYWSLRDSRGGSCSYASWSKVLPLPVNGVFSCDRTHTTHGSPSCRHLTDTQPVRRDVHRAGLGIAASVINFVVLTAAASSANYDIYCLPDGVRLRARRRRAEPVRKAHSRRVPANALYLRRVPGAW